MMANPSPSNSSTLKPPTVVLTGLAEDSSPPLRISEIALVVAAAAPAPSGADDDYEIES